MDKKDIQTMARDIIVQIGKDGYYHAGCARLSVAPSGKAWNEVGYEVSLLKWDAKSRIELKLEIMRLVKAWDKIHNEKEVPPEFEVKG
jgi:hypothetical protein